MSTLRLTNKALSAAAADAAVLWLQTLPAPDACTHRFSEDFERKMAPLLEKTRRREKRIAFARSVAAALITLLIGFAAWMAVDTNARAAVVNWAREIYENSVIYRFFGSREDAAFPAYRLTKLPDGFAEAERYEDDTGCMILYFNRETHDTVVFDCRWMTEDASVALAGIDSTAAQEEVQIRGRSADYYSGGATSNRCLVWYSEDETVLFSLNSTLEKAVLIEMAESVVPSDPGK